MGGAGAHGPLSGRRALVTGAGQGIGAAIAATLASAGATVGVNDLRADRAEDEAETLRADGYDATAIPFDVTDYGAVRAAIEAAGPFEILVSNAGNAGGDAAFALTRFHDTEPADWEPYLAVNLYGVMHCVRAVLPGMIAAGWGRIVTVISDAGRVGESKMAAYAAAKAGAAGLTRAVAKEAGRHGVTANNISLGHMRTPFTEAAWTGDDPPGAAIVRNYPIRRPGLPEDVAGLVAYLTSPGASWITGQTIPLNGGYSLAL